MKTTAWLITLALICIIPANGYPHPGKTDRHGGHKCLKGCEEWKLYYSEYHLHDKYGKPIRVVKKDKKRITKELITAPSVTELSPQLEPPKTAQTVTVYKYIFLSSEEREPFNPLLWVLLILLLLLLIIRMGRKEKKT